MRQDSRYPLTDIALERLHLLKKDASQIGQNARKAVKFLDQISSTTELAHEPVMIQGPDEQYAKWPQVEAQYGSAIIRPDNIEDVTKAESDLKAQAGNKHEASPEEIINELDISAEDVKISPLSTPPSTPPASEPQSTKTSPEVACANIVKHDATPIPPVLKSLINFVVWYTHESKSGKSLEKVFLTNSADAAQIAKDFEVVPKTIHQLRASIPLVEHDVQLSDANQHKKKGSGHRSSDSEPKTLFRYDEVSSEDEQLVFRPRTKDGPRPGSSGRNGPNVAYRGRGAFHSPSNSVNVNNTPKPQVPVEEIDPDSFDRGTFGRGSTPLANVGNHHGPQVGVSPSFSRGGYRNFSSPMSRGTGYRGSPGRGRGRGRLFVP